MIQHEALHVLYYIYIYKSHVAPFDGSQRIHDTFACMKTRYNGVTMATGPVDITWVTLASLLLVLCNVVCSGPIQEAEENGGNLPDSLVELWLEDYTRTKDDVSTDAMLSDSPSLGLAANLRHRCPSDSRDVTDTGACQQRTCTSDRACALQPGFKCCFNGCVKTCTLGIPQAPVVDWIREPPRDPETGRSWLMRPQDLKPYSRPAELQIQNEAMCNPIGEGGRKNQPLCPIGFICHVTDTENVADYIGTCVPDDSDGAHAKFKISASMSGTLDCHVHKTTYRNGESLVYHKHECTCHRGDVTCRVGQDMETEKGG